MEAKLALCLLLLVGYIVDESEQKLSGAQRKRLENIKNTEDFFQKLLRPAPPGTSQTQEGRKIESKIFDTRQGSISASGSAQVASQLAPFDSCEPRDTSVTLPQPAAAQEMYWPSCTKVKRCGGCACSSMSECVPTPEGKQTTNLQVMRCKVDGDSFNIIGIDFVKTETHTSCMCDCKVKESDCNLAIHWHDRDTCQCKCHNAADATKCSSDRKWNGTTCSCECKDVYRCHEDEYYSHDTCRCEVGKTPTHNTGGSLIDGTGNRGDPCAFKTCSFGYVKQPYNGQCRCVVAPSRPNVREGRISNRRRATNTRSGERTVRRGSSMLPGATGRRARG